MPNKPVSLKIARVCLFAYFVMEHLVMMVVLLNHLFLTHLFCSAHWYFILRFKKM